MADVVDNPHFAIPMTFGRGHVAVHEQDSEPEILQTATVSLRYELGQRTMLPEYGLSDQALLMNGPNEPEVRAAIHTWDDRVETEIETTVMEEVVHTVAVTIGAENG